MSCGHQRRLTFGLRSEWSYVHSYSRGWNRDMNHLYYFSLKSAFGIRGMGLSRQLQAARLSGTRKPGRHQGKYKLPTAGSPIHITSRLLPFAAYSCFIMAPSGRLSLNYRGNSTSESEILTIRQKTILAFLRFSMSRERLP